MLHPPMASHDLTMVFVFVCLLCISNMASGVAAWFMCKEDDMCYMYVGIPMSASLCLVCILGLFYLSRRGGSSGYVT